MADIELAQVLKSLRKELQQAQRDGKGESLRFGISELEVELQVSVAEQVGGSGGVKFWVVNASGNASSTDRSVQKIRLKLDPKTKDGKRAEISDKTTRPK